MKDLLPFLIVGVTSGSLYGLAAVGLVLTFRTSGIFNFAHGAVAAAAAYAFYDLRSEVGLPWPIALLVCVAVLGPAVGFVVDFVTRGVAASRPVLTVVATVGLLLMTQGFLTWRYSALTLDFPAFLPTSGPTIAGVHVQIGQLITIAVGIVATTGLYFFLRFTRPGRAMRAVVEDPSLVALTGTDSNGVRSVAWMIGCSFAALSGILIAPSLGRDATLLTLLVVQAFGAAAVGSFASLPVTYAGGVGLGIAASVATKYFAGSRSLAGIPSALPFLVLFVLLVVLPARRFAVLQRSRRTAAPRPRPAPRTLLIGGAGLVAAAGAVPFVVGAKLPVFIAMAGLVFIFLSLSLLVWTSGQISLCHAVFAALGATTMSRLTTDAGVPWLLAVLLAGCATIPLGAIVALPALRLSGIYLALATFGFGVVMQRVVYSTDFMFGQNIPRAAPRFALGPIDGSDDRTFYLVVMALALLAVVGVLAIHRSRLGLFLRALGDSPTALTSHGLSVLTTRLVVFCLSAFLAGVAGAIMISSTGQVSADAFGPFLSLLWLAVLAVSGTRKVVSPVAAAVLLAVVPSYLPAGFSDYQTMLFGAAAVAASLLIDRHVTLGGRRTVERLEGGPGSSRLSEGRPAQAAVAA